jgi:uncharacterized damage-inducible protein DinB
VTGGLIDNLRAARAELLAACEGASDAELRRRPSDGEWAVIEVLAHIPEVDRYYLSEARKIRDDPGHMFVYFDEAGWKRDNTHAIERDARAVKLVMAIAHEEVVRWAESLTPDELERSGGHPRRGSITVRQMLERIANHDRNHAEQVRAVRNAMREHAR